MHGTRDCTINEHAVDVSCTRCSETEDQNHVVKFRCIKERRNAYLSKLRLKLEKVDDANEDQIKTKKIVSDTRTFLNNETSFETTQ